MATPAVDGDVEAGPADVGATDDGVEGGGDELGPGCSADVIEVADAVAGGDTLGCGDAGDASGAAVPPAASGVDVEPEGEPGDWVDGEADVSGVDAEADGDAGDWVDGEADASEVGAS